MNENDHDLIIRLDTKLDLLTKKVEDLDNNIVRRVDSLEIGEASSQQVIKELKTTSYDHETRIRRLERWALTAIGGLSVINLAIELYILFVR